MLKLISKKLVTIFAFFIFIFAALAFQNCSQPKKETFGVQESNIPTGELKNCFFDGNKYEEGQSVTAYLVSSVPTGSTCTQESRICHSGAFSGSFSFAGCSVGGTALCMFNGHSLAHNSSITAYQNSTVPSGSTCAAQTRTCNNGVLSGSYNYATCAVAAAPSCLFNGQTIASAGVVTAYQSSTVATGHTCVSEVRTCKDGSLSGSYSFGSCVVNGPQACLFNGSTIASGSSVVAYSSSNVNSNNQCISQIRTCSNGVLSGSFSYGSCVVNGGSACIFNGSSIAHGESVAAFFASTVYSGQSCTSEVRTCNNGTLSGSANFPSCTAVTANNGSCPVNSTFTVDICTTGTYPFRALVMNGDCSGINGTWTYTAPANGEVNFAFYSTCGSFRTSRALSSGESMDWLARTNCYGSSDGGSTVYHFIDSIKCENGKITKATTRGTCDPTGSSYGYCQPYNGGGGDGDGSN